MNKSSDLTNLIEALVNVHREVEPGDEICECWKKNQEVFLRFGLSVIQYFDCIYGIEGARSIFVTLLMHRSGQWIECRFLQETLGGPKKNPNKKINPVEITSPLSLVKEPEAG